MEFYWTSLVLILIVVAILAKAYPPLGADYLQPDITHMAGGVFHIFLAGLGLKTEEFSKSLSAFGSICLCSYFVFRGGSTVYGMSRLLSYGCSVPRFIDSMSL
jgi:sodium/bile acid cotransporter 7